MALAVNDHGTKCKAISNACDCERVKRVRCGVVLAHRCSTGDNNVPAERVIDEAVSARKNASAARVAANGSAEQAMGRKLSSVKDYSAEIARIAFFVT